MCGHASSTTIDCRILKSYAEYYYTRKDVCLRVISKYRTHYPQSLHLTQWRQQNMRQSRLTAIAGVFLTAALSAPAWGADPAQSDHAKANPARPGSLNYIEGQASIEGQGLGPEAIGN